MTPKASRKFPTACVLYISVLVEISLITGLVAGPTFQRILSLSEMQLGIALSTAYFGLLLIAPIAGHLTHVRGSLTSLSCGILLEIMSMLTIIVAPGFYVLLIGLLGVGAAAGLIINANINILGDLFPTSNRQILSIASALWFGSSTFSAPLIGGWLDYAKKHDFAAWSYQGVYILEIVLMMGALALSLFVLQARLPDHQLGKDGDKTKKQGFELRQLWIPSLGMCQGLTLIVLMAWMNPLVQEKFGVGDFRGGLAMGAVAFGLGTGRLVFSRIRSQGDDRKIIALTALVGGGTILGGLISPFYWLTLICVALGAFVSGPVGPSIMALPRRIFPDEKARVIGYYQASLALAGLVGPSIVGALAERDLLIWIGVSISPLAALIMTFLSIVWMKTEPFDKMVGQETE